MERWLGRVALVTGASGGIGGAITRTLVQHGMKVVVCARKKNELQKLAEEINKSRKTEQVFAVPCDISEEAQVLSMFSEIKQKYGHLDVCINNAGILSGGSLLDGDASIWKKMLEVNVLGLSICTRESVKLMREKNIDDGQIIHISSIAAHVVPPKGYAHFYSATKFATKALTEGLRLELNQLKSKIKVSSISPGFVKTDLTLDLWGEEKLREMQSSIPVMYPDDVAQLVVSVLQTPPHVQVHDFMVRPTLQGF